MKLFYGWWHNPSLELACDLISYFVALRNIVHIGESGVVLAAEKSLRQIIWIGIPNSSLQITKQNVKCKSTNTLSWKPGRVLEKVPRPTPRHPWWFQISIETKMVVKLENPPSWSNWVGIKITVFGKGHSTMNQVIHTRGKKDFPSPILVYIVCEQPPSYYQLNS